MFETIVSGLAYDAPLDTDKRWQTMLESDNLAKVAKDNEIVKSFVRDILKLLDKA